MRVALLLVAVASVAHADRRLPTVTIGPPTVSPGLSEAIVTRYLKRQHAKFQYCYDRELLDDPTLAGPMHVTFEIDAAGRVLNASASGVSAAVSACDAGVLRDVMFPAPTTKATVYVAFLLRHER